MIRLLGLAIVPLTLSAYLFAAASLKSGMVPKWIEREPVIALQANIRAIQLYPFRPWPRLQLALTLRAVVGTHKEKVRLAPEAADRIHWWASTAMPRSPGVLIARAEYLLNSGRWGESDEIDRIFETLREVSTMYAHGYALEALYAGLLGDEERTEWAVRQALQRPQGALIFQNLGMLRTETEQ